MAGALKDYQAAILVGEKTFGKGTVQKVINLSEIEKNFSIFVEAMDYLRDGDEIFLDITHSFKSLPLFTTTALSFIKDVANKKIHLSGIYYGMLEAGREFDNNIVPVVDLSYISELQNWIKGAHSFYHFRNNRLHRRPQV